MRSLLCQQLIHNVHLAALRVQGHQTQIVEDVPISLFGLALRLKTAIILITPIDILPSPIRAVAG